MRITRIGAMLVISLAIACDKSSGEIGATPSASAVTPTPPPPASTPAAVVSAAPSTSAAGDDSAPAKDAMVVVKDPTAETAKTVKALAGGSVTLYLAEPPGVSWTAGDVAKALGKAKEQTIPGFAGPTVPAHEFKWSTAGVKAGQYKVEISRKGGKGPGFTLTIDVT